MKTLPKIALVGRPNVGKSALFNCLVGKRIAIVDEAAGITRDRLTAPCDFFGKPFELIDTGGIDEQSDALFNELVLQQALTAIEEADALIMVVDATIGITDLDHSLARRLLKSGKPLCLAVNKIDAPSREHLIHEFHPLGIREMVAVSALQAFQMAELLDAVFPRIQSPEREEEETERKKIALIGRPNVGKSTLINHFLQEERCIVSPIPGTTRDSIDIDFAYAEEHYTLIDTAGIRRKKAEHEVVDKFAAIRTQRTIERADVCILMLDAREGMTHQEKRIANQIESAGKSCILVFNKWDLVKGFRMEHCLQRVRQEVPFLSHCPAIFTSAHTGRNTQKLFPLVEEVFHQWKTRIGTGTLNSFIEECIAKCHPPMIQGKRLRIYYASQTGIQPPQITFFINHKSLLTGTYQKYLMNRLRETFPFTGSPVRFFIRDKGERQQKKAAELAAAK